MERTGRLICLEPQKSSICFTLAINDQPNYTCNSNKNTGKLEMGAIEKIRKKSGEEIERDDSPHCTVLED